MKLKSCPFCGNNNPRHIKFDNAYRCDECGTLGPTIYDFAITQDSYTSSLSAEEKKEFAAILWNRHVIKSKRPCPSCSEKLWLPYWCYYFTTENYSVDLEEEPDIEPNIDRIEDSDFTQGYLSAIDVCLHCGTTVTD